MSCDPGSGFTAFESAEFDALRQTRDFASRVAELVEPFEAWIEENRAIEVPRIGVDDVSPFTLRVIERTREEIVTMIYNIITMMDRKTAVVVNGMERTGALGSVSKEQAICLLAEYIHLVADGPHAL